MMSVGFTRQWNDERPLLSASWKRSSTGTGVKTQFSGFGYTPTGELIVQVCQRKRQGIVFFLKKIPNKRLDTRLLTFLNASVYSNVYRLMRCCFLRIEVLNKSRISVEIGPCRVP